MNTMGMFDTVHTGARCGQTKAFGRSLADLRPGSRVDAVPAPLTEEEWNAAQEHGERPHDFADFQAAMAGGGYVQVRDHIITSWDDTPSSVPCVSYVGHLVTPSDALGPDLERVQALRAVVDGGQVTESEHDQVINGIYGRPNLAELTGSVRSEREEALREAAVLELAVVLNLPGECGICAQLRAVS